MLEYSKHILEKVSFEPALFSKEYIKSMTYLTDKEKKELEIWCSERFKVL